MRSLAPAASVIVPTRDRPESLSACLTALEAQAGIDFETVVVDDGSSDGAAVAAVVAAAPHARLVTGRGRGPATARNLGAASARSPVLCFTDDDCRPAPGWLAALLARLDAGAEAVAGATVNGRPGDVCATASQLVTNHLTESTFDPAGGCVGFAPTCNLACRRDVHAAVPFDETFPLAAGEDREWCSRLAALGISLAFEPTAQVSHHQDLSLVSFWNQQVRYGRGAHRWRRMTTGAGRQEVRFYAALLGKGLAAGPRVGALVVAAQAGTAVGMAREALGQRRRGPDAAR